MPMPEKWGDRSLLAGFGNLLLTRQA